MKPGIRYDGSQRILVDRYGDEWAVDRIPGGLRFRHRARPVVTYRSKPGELRTFTVERLEQVLLSLYYYGTFVTWSEEEEKNERAQKEAQERGRTLRQAVRAWAADSDNTRKQQDRIGREEYARSRRTRRYPRL